MEIIEYEGKWIGVAVYRSPRVKFLKDPAKLLNEFSKDKISVNIFRADSIISLKQINTAAVSALNAFKSRSNIAKNLGIEILLRISSETQIEKALKKLSIDEITEEVGVCIITEDLVELRQAVEKISSIIDGVELVEENLHNDDRVARALEFYGISREELSLVQARDLHMAALLLILEKIVTLDIER